MLLSVVTSRELDMPQSPNATAGARGEDGGRWVNAQVGQSSYRTTLTARTHTFRADEPLASGGTDTGPTPYEYLLAALSSCMAMTLRMYADRKGWPLASVEVRLRTARQHAPDCESCDTATVGITRIEATYSATSVRAGRVSASMVSMAATAGRELCPARAHRARAGSPSPAAHMESPRAADPRVRHASYAEGASGQSA